MNHFKKAFMRKVISVIFTWFLLSSYLLKLLVFLYFLIFIFIYLFICAFKEWEDFRLIYKGFTCKVGLSQLNQANLHPTRNEFKWRPTQLNSSSIGARNQTKFAPNPSPIRIRISACTSVSIFGITFGSDIQSRWFKLGWKVSLKGYNFVVYQLIYSYTGLKKREDIWGEKKKEERRRRKLYKVPFTPMFWVA